MLKKNAFQVAVIYGTKIAIQDFDIKTSRAIRTLMKPYMEFATGFESDRNDILTHPKLSDTEKQKEFTTLQNEEIALDDTIPAKLLDLLSETDIRLSAADLNVIEGNF